MSRRSLVAASVALVFALSASVFAGGGAGGSKGGIPVRMRNVGVAPVGVNAISGAATVESLTSGARVLAANGIAQFGVKKGNFTAVAADPNNPLVTNRVRNFSTREFKTIYLYAQQDGTAATLVGAPGGVKF